MDSSLNNTVYVNVVILSRYFSKTKTSLSYLELSVATLWFEAAFSYMAYINIYDSINYICKVRIQTAVGPLVTTPMIELTSAVLVRTDEKKREEKNPCQFSIFPTDDCYFIKT